MTSHRKKCATLLLILIFASVVATVSSAYAQENKNRKTQTLALSIDKKDLAGALRELSLAADLQLISLSQLFEGKTSAGLQGTYTVSEALEALLSGTSLKYEFISEKIVVISERVESALAPQQASAPIEEEPKNTTIEVVTVTGSRIPRSQFDLPYPTQSIGPLYIERQSFTTVGDAINSLPVMCESAYSLNASGSGGNIGEAYGDLYCLGSQRTLTLINGRRTISSNDPSVTNPEPGLQVDLNMIPRIMMKNIEVIGVGSAPVYGSDAVAGTINIILKDQFDGFELDVDRGVSNLNDATQENISMLLGRNFSQGSGNVTLAYEYHKQRRVDATDREYTRFDRDYVEVDRIVGDSFNRDYRFEQDIVNPLLTAGGIPTPFNGIPRFALGQNAFYTGDSQPLVFGEDQALRVFNRGNFTNALSQRGGGDGIREQIYRTLRVPIERHVVNLSTHIDISPERQAFAEFQFYRNRSSSVSDIGDVVPTSINSGLDASVINGRRFGIGFNSTFISAPVASDNPFLDPAQSELLALTGNSRSLFFLNKDWRSVIDPKATSTSTIYRVVLGVRGEELWGDHYWNWELTYNKGISESDITKRRVDAQNFAKSLNAVRNAQDQIICESDPETCVPFNPFGANSSQASIDYISKRVIDSGEIGQDVVTASVRGGISELPGGPLTLVLGTELRSEDAEYRPADILEPRSSDVDDAIVNEFANEFNTKEVFFEVVAPVLGEGVLPGLSKIELEANGRGIDHSNAGSDKTWAIGSRFMFDNTFASVVLRGNLGRSVRAPSLFEFFRPFTLFNTELNDPCDAQYVGRGSNSDNRERTCVEQASALALVYNSNDFNALIPDAGPLRLGGTPDLENEQANSYTLGVVFDSNAADLLRFSADLIDIEIQEAIIERNLNRLVEQCYDARILRVCDDFIRDPRTFQLFAIKNAYENIGKISLRAIQYNLLYGFNLGAQRWIPGEFTLDISAYNLREFIDRDRLSSVDRLGTLDYPKWRAATTLVYSHQNLELSWSSHYTSEVSIDLPFQSEALKPPTVDSYWQHNLSMAYEFSDMLRARLGVRNVLDESPPDGLPSSEVGSAYDALGRYYSIGVSLRF